MASAKQWPCTPIVQLTFANSFFLFKRNLICLNHFAIGRQLLPTTIKSIKNFNYFKFKYNQTYKCNSNAKFPNCYSKLHLGALWKYTFIKSYWIAKKLYLFRKWKDALIDTLKFDKKRKFCMSKNDLTKNYYRRCSKDVFIKLT